MKKIFMTIALGFVIVLCGSANAGMMELLVPGFYDFDIREGVDHTTSADVGLKFVVSQNEEQWALVDADLNILVMGNIENGNGMYKDLLTENNDLICRYTILGCKLPWGAYLIIRDAVKIDFSTVPGYSP